MDVRKIGAFAVVLILLVTGLSCVVIGQRSDSQVLSNPTATTYGKTYDGGGLDIVMDYGNDEYTINEDKVDDVGIIITEQYIIDFDPTSTNVKVYHGETYDTMRKTIHFDAQLTNAESLGYSKVDNDIVFTFSVLDGFRAPTLIEVTGVTQYTYTTSAVIVPISAITGDVSITVVAVPVYYNYSVIVTNGTSDVTSGTLDYGESLYVTFTADSGYVLGTPTVTMDGQSMTEYAYDSASGLLTIDANDIDGDIVVRMDCQQEYKWVKFTSLDDNNTISMRKNNNNIHVSYSLDDGTTWTELTTSVTIDEGEYIYLKGVNTSWATNVTVSYTSGFNVTGHFTVSGRATALINGTGSEITSNTVGLGGLFYNCAGLTTINSDFFEGYNPMMILWSYVYMFYGCTSLVNAPEMDYSSPTSYHGMDYMFYGCTALETAPSKLQIKTMRYAFVNCYRLTYAPTIDVGTIESDCMRYAFQNCVSLRTTPTLVWDGYMNNKTNCFAYAFDGCYSLSGAMIVDHKDALGNYTYDYCYHNCKSLVTAIDLTVDTVGMYACRYMYYGCTALETAPILSATTLNSYCYQYMFSGCTSLKTAPELPATDLKTYCYSNMFYGCTSLKTAPELPATYMTSYCYQYMFYGCTSLTTADLDFSDITYLASYCFAYMFRGCTGLVGEVIVPDFEKGSSQVLTSPYQYMFYGCTKITKATILLITSDYSSGFSYMFYGCTSLKTIVSYTETIVGTQYTSWLSSASSTGTFYNLGGAGYSVGVSGIPSGWTVATQLPTGAKVGSLMMFSAYGDGNPLDSYTIQIDSDITSLRITYSNGILTLVSDIDTLRYTVTSLILINNVLDDSDKLVYDNALTSTYYSKGTQYTYTNDHALYKGTEQTVGISNTATETESESSGIAGVQEYASGTMPIALTVSADHQYTVLDKEYSEIEQNGTIYFIASLVIIFMGLALIVKLFRD